MYAKNEKKLISKQKVSKALKCHAYILIFCSYIAHFEEAVADTNDSRNQFVPIYHQRRMKERPIPPLDRDEFLDVDEGELWFLEDSIELDVNDAVNEVDPLALPENHEVGGLSSIHANAAIGHGVSNFGASTSAERNQDQVDTTNLTGLPPANGVSDGNAVDENRPFNEEENRLLNEEDERPINGSVQQNVENSQALDIKPDNLIVQHTNNDSELDDILDETEGFVGQIDMPKPIALSANELVKRENDEMSGNIPFDAKVSLL